MVTMFKNSFKESLIKQAMEVHKLKREDAVKLVRSIELKEEVKLSKSIDEFSKSLSTSKKEGTEL